MSPLKFNKNKIEKLVRKAFPNSTIESHKRFSTGLVSPVFKVKVKNPSKNLVIKFGKLKNKAQFIQSNRILDYLHDNQLPAPRVFFEGEQDHKFITIMDYSPGKVASKIYQKANNKLKKEILIDAG